MRLLGFAALLAVLMLTGCATITGTVTGAFTGPGDLQGETYIENQAAFDRNPMLFGLNALVVGPCGIAVGPVAGLVKGLALDVQWLHGMIDYRDVFCTYGDASIWRPCTFEWLNKQQRLAYLEVPERTETPAVPGQP